MWSEVNLVIRITFNSHLFSGWACWVIVISTSIILHVYVRRIIGVIHTNFYRIGFLLSHKYWQSVQYLNMPAIAIVFIRRVSFFTLKVLLIIA